MQDRVPVNPGRVLVTPENGEAAFYATLTRADNPTQEGTPLNKATLFKDATAAIFGLGSGAVPDEALAILGKYRQHWWKRVGFVPAHATETAFTNKFFPFANSSSYTSYIYYSDTIKVATDGTVSLGGDPKSIMDNYQTISAYGASYLAGKYFEVYEQRTATGKIYYFDPSATMTATTNSAYTYKYGFTISASKQITGHADAYGAAEYLQSNNRNAYPDSGVNSGYAYEYCGVPLDNAVSVPRIVTGSYKGTGTYGASNPNSLTFDFEPQIIMLLAMESSSSFYTLFGNSQARAGIFAIYPPILTDTYKNNAGFLVESSQGQNVSAKKEGNTVYWYSTESNAAIQANGTGFTYHYMAIG